MFNTFNAIGFTCGIHNDWQNFAVRILISENALLGKQTILKDAAWEDLQAEM